MLQVDMPVFFYVDPEFCDDPRLEAVDDIILSYTFFEAKEGHKLTLPNYFKPHRQWWCFDFWWNISHRLFVIHLCSVLPPPSSSRCTCILLSTSPSPDLFSRCSFFWSSSSSVAVWHPLQQGQINKNREKSFGPTHVIKMKCQMTVFCSFFCRLLKRENASRPDNNIQGGPEKFGTFIVSLILHQLWPHKIFWHLWGPVKCGTRVRRNMFENPLTRPSTGVLDWQCSHRTFFDSVPKPIPLFFSYLVQRSGSCSDFLNNSLSLMISRQCIFIILQKHLLMSTCTPPVVLCVIVKGPDA